MSTKKGAGSSRNGRDSAGRRLGLKCGSGQYVRAGTILIRQRGMKYKVHNNVGVGKDHTLFSLVDGTVYFKIGQKSRTYVGVNPLVTAN